MSLIKRRQPAKAAEYREEAQGVRVDVRRARAALARERARSASDINAIVERVDSTDDRISASIESLRSAREMNHFTDRIRALMEGSLKHG